MTMMLSAWQIANWKSKINNSSATESELRRNAGPSAFQLQECMLKNDKTWCRYLAINCASLRTFWTPLVLTTYIAGFHVLNNHFITIVQDKLIVENYFQKIIFLQTSEQIQTASQALHSAFRQLQKTLHRIRIHVIKSI